MKRLQISVSEMPARARQKYPYQIAEAYDAMRATIGSGLRERLKAPQQLPPDIASLVALLAFAFGRPPTGLANASVAVLPSLNGFPCHPALRASSKTQPLLIPPSLGGIVSNTRATASDPL